VNPVGSRRTGAPAWVLVAIAVIASMSCGKGRGLRSLYPTTVDGAMDGVGAVGGNRGNLDADTTESLDARSDLTTDNSIRVEGGVGGTGGSGGSSDGATDGVAQGSDAAVGFSADATGGRGTGGVGGTSDAGSGGRKDMGGGRTGGWTGEVEPDSLGDSASAGPAESGSSPADRPIDDVPSVASDGAMDGETGARRDAEEPEAGIEVGHGGGLTLLAGGLGGPGAVDGVRAAARFNAPLGVVGDGAGSLFVADTANHTIRRIVIATGQVATFVGSPGQQGSSDGMAIAARFQGPRGLATDGLGNLFVTDTDNHAIRKVVIATSEVRTLAGSPDQSGGIDGIGAEASFSAPEGVASDGAGSLFIADSGSNTIRQVTIATGKVTTLAGSAGQSGNADGTGAAARFLSPRGVASDGGGNLFVTDSSSHVIRKVVIETAEVTTLVGRPGEQGSEDGAGAAASFCSPSGIASDRAGNLFVADTSNYTIRNVIIATGAVTTVAGSPGEFGNTDGAGAAARFLLPYAVVADGTGNLFVADTNNHAIRKVALPTRQVTTVAGAGKLVGSNDGIGAAARFYGPQAVASDGAGNLFVADRSNHVIRKIAISTGEVTTLAGSPELSGSDDGIGAAARFCGPQGVASDRAGKLFVADTDNRTLRMVVIATGEVTTLAGSPGESGSIDGKGAAARFALPWHVASDGADGLFVTDPNDHTIRKVVVATGEVTTLAGSAGQEGDSDGVGAAARFHVPQGVACDRAGNLFVSDRGNQAIRKVVVVTGEVTSLVGSSGHGAPRDGIGADAGFGNLGAIASDEADNLFVVDGSSIRKIAVSSRTVTTVVGSLDRSGVVLGPLPAGLNGPMGLAVGPAGELFVSDAVENAILVARF
jgi:hypothetical protein